MRDKSSITRSQRTILDAVVFFLQKGEIPTVREIGAVAGLRSPATVFKHLRTLEKLGILTLSGKSRGVRIVSEEALASVGLKPKKKAKRGGQLFSISAFAPAQYPGIPLVGEIAAGKPIESYSEAFLPDGVDQHGLYRDENPSRFTSPSQAPTLPLDPALFGESGGELMALRVDGSSMINAGILHGDYVIIRRQNAVEEGEIAAVIVNGEGTLKRWKSQSSTTAKNKKGTSDKKVTLIAANELFDPIEISEEDGKDVVVFGKYVGLVRGNLQFNR